MMFKRVLVGVDRVDASRTPLWETVGRLSLEDGAQLIIAHVVESHPGRFGLLHEGYEEVEQHLAEARAAIEAAGGKVDRSIEVGIGLKSPSDVLVEMARTEQCDLIVLGTHRHGAWSGALLGSVSQRVAGHSSCPVLLVPCGD
jgi:nucleotide-binding universal stress UspA family protein